MTDRDIFLRDVPEDVREDLAFSRWQENMRIGTHTEGCHAWGISHYECAKRRITELEAQLADAQKDAARYQWIPVSGRLPKEGDVVNVVFDGCCMETDLFESGVFQCFGRRPTHWMPLPKMPVMQPNGAAMTTTPNLSSEDIMVWPDDMLGSTWCYRDELEEMNHMSDDYITLYVGSKAWIKHVESQ